MRKISNAIPAMALRSDLHVARVLKIQHRPLFILEDHDGLDPMVSPSLQIGQFPFETDFRLCRKV